MEELFAPAPEPPTPLGRYRILAPSAGVRVSPLQLGAMSIGDAWSSFMGSMNKEQSFKLLDEVASVLARNPTLGPVLIEGHTDNVGARALNLDLSNRRARAVLEYLVGKGIDRGDHIQIREELGLPRDVAG